MAEPTVETLSVETPRASTHLERYLESADVLERFPWGGDGGGHAEKFTVLLEGGVLALAKAGVDEASIKQAKHERAAWLIADALGIRHLVAPTILRDVLHADESRGKVSCALRAHWPEADPWPPVTEFDPDDIEATAILDFLIAQNDRNGNNYLRKLRRDATSRLILIDHGNAFGEAYGPVSSAFLTHLQGQPLTSVGVKRVGGLLAAKEGELQELLTEGEHRGVFERRDALEHARAFPAAP